jgi:eukaryotic-like serine/threonine-protein kinase
MPHVVPLHAGDPRRLGRYRLAGRIADMPADGPVYLGQAPEGSEVTITLLEGDWAGDGAARDRFTAEANAASRVAPFCAARILGAGFEGGYAFLVSEYIAGPSLLEIVTDDGPWEGADLEALAIGTATGLAAIHQAGLVHGDFGPEYVVLGANGPRVVEFGITPPYGAATPAADMRAWAHTMLYAAAGGRADPGDPQDLNLLPEPLRGLVRQCTSADPGEQPTARTAVIELLGDDNPPAGVFGEGARRAQRASVQPPPAPDEAPDQPRRGRIRGRRTVAIWWVAGVAVCIVAIVLAIRFAQSQSGQPSAATTTPPGGRATASPRGSGRATPPTPTVTVPAAASGTWTGLISQQSPSGTFSVTVRVTLGPGAPGGTVRYSGPFTCVDDLSLVSDRSGILTLNQGVVKGPCQPGVVTLSPGSASFSGLSFSFKGKGAPAATGVLQKTTS